MNAPMKSKTETHCRGKEKEEPCEAWGDLGKSGKLPIANRYRPTVNGPWQIRKTANKEDMGMSQETAWRQIFSTSTM